MSKGGHPATLTRAGLGRRKGSRNKFTTLKNMFIGVCKRLGGEDKMLDWAGKRNNLAQFYQMLSKMLPNKVEAEVTQKQIIIERADKPPKKDDKNE